MRCDPSGGQVRSRPAEETDVAEMICCDLDVAGNTANRVARSSSDHGTMFGNFILTCDARLFERLVRFMLGSQGNTF